MALKFNNLNLVLILFASQIGWQTINGARILGVFPTPSISHQVVFRVLMEELAKRGHELVVLTPDPVHYKDDEYKNLTEIDVHDVSYKIWHETFNFVQERMKDPTPMGVLETYYDVMLVIADKQLEHPMMKALLENPKDKFDLCMVEGIIPMYTLLKDHFNCPLIQINSLSGIYTNFENMGSPSHPTLLDDFFNPYDPDDMNFWKRMYLIKERLIYMYLNSWKYPGPYNELAKKHFGENARLIEEAEKDIDMVFLNVHPAISGARPLAPAIIQMGSMHIKPHSSPPADIKKVLDAAHNGAIYFSLGSNVRSCDLPEEKVMEILEVFKSLPYTILWKWENDKLANKPDNVFISKWFPQQSILGHKNVKLFITQGGQQSMEESIHNKVPLIGIPFLGDQYHNVIRIVKLGIGKKLLFETLDKSTLNATIWEVMSNPSYRNNIIKLRELIYDQPQTAIERSVWWTEYVIRHKGAQHLKPPTVGMSWMDYYLVFDILIILGIAATLTISTVCVVIKIVTIVLSKNKTKSKKS